MLEDFKKEKIVGLLGPLRYIFFSFFFYRFAA